MDFVKAAFDFLSSIWSFVLALFEFLINFVTSITEVFNFISSFVFKIPTILMTIYNYLPDFMQFGLFIVTAVIVFVFVLKIIVMLKDATTKK